MKEFNVRQKFASIRVIRQLNPNVFARVGYFVHKSVGAMISTHSIADFSDY
jgi:hypothetical protein